MSTKDEYIAQLRAKLAEWNAEIDKLEAQGRQMQAQASHSYHERMGQLLAVRDKAAAQLEELQASSGDAWQSVREKTESLWNNLKSKLGETSEAFRSTPRQ